MGVLDGSVYNHRPSSVQLYQVCLSRLLGCLSEEQLDQVRTVKKSMSRGQRLPHNLMETSGDVGDMSLSLAN
jgi:hypothetical protein